MRNDVETSRDGHVPSIGVGLLIARVEIRRSVRKLREQDVWLAVLVLGAVGVLLSLPILFGHTREWGVDLAAGETSVASTVAMALAVVWLLFALFAVVSAVGEYGEIDNESGMLTIRPPKDVACGLLLSATVWYAPFAFVPLGVGFLGLSVGAGSPLAFVGGVVATTVLLVTAVATGYPVGLALKGVIRRSERLSSLKPILAVVVTVAYVWIMATGKLLVIAETLEPVLLAPPLGWLGDLALVTTPGADASIARAAGALVLAVVVLPAAALGTTASAGYAWYADRAWDSCEGDRHGDDHSSPGRVAATLALVCRRPGTLGVATTTLVRAYRAPLQLVFAAVPLLGALPLFERVIATGTAPPFVPWVVLLYGAWAAGTAFPLNALGNQGSTLPTALTARADGACVVHGTVVAAVVTVTPLTAVAAVGMGYLAGRSPADLLVLTALSPVVVTAGAVLAAGLGARFPRFRSIDVAGSRTAVPPSKSAFALFSLLITLAVYAVAVLADETIRSLAVVVLSERLPYGLSITATTLETVASVVAPLLALAVPAAYLLAVRRIDSYRLE